MKKSCLFIGGSRDGEWIKVEYLPHPRFALPEIWKVEKTRETMKEHLFKDLSNPADIMYETVEFEIYHRHKLNVVDERGYEHCWNIYTFEKISVATLIEVLVKGYKAK